MIKTVTEYPYNLQNDKEMIQTIADAITISEVISFLPQYFTGRF